MRALVAVLILTALVAVTARGQTNEVPTKAFDDYPITGMGITDFVACLNALKAQIPVGPKIIGLQITNGRKITITTGEISGPLTGSGQIMTFEVRKGKWVLTESVPWHS